MLDKGPFDPLSVNLLCLPSFFQYARNIVVFILLCDV